jgi:hypothetical protein
MSNRAQRRADEAAKRRAPTKVSAHRRHLDTKKRVALLMEDIRRRTIDVKESAEKMLDSLAAITHEMAIAEKAGFDNIADLASQALTQAMTANARQALRQWKWPDESLETIDQTILNEVVRRSYIRSDLALALSFTDRLALIGYGAKLEGHDPEKTMRDFYAKTLGSEKTAELRDRLVAMHWRGANADTLEDLTVFYVLDNLERCAQLAKDFSILEDVEHDNPIQANEGFGRRLDEEYNQTLWPDESAQMYRITQTQARAHFEEFKDRVIDMTDRQITEFAKTVKITGEWPEVRSQVLKLGWRGASEQTIDGMFSDSILREIRTMARAARGNPTTVPADPTPPTKPKLVSDEIVARLTESQRRCLQAIIEQAEALPRPLTKPWAILGFEDGDGVHVVSDPADIAILTGGGAPGPVKPYADAISKAIDEGLRDSTRAREPVIAVLVDREEVPLKGRCTWVGLDLHGTPITNPTPVTEERWKKSMRGPTFYASTFDRALMRLGARLWQETYAKGMPENKIAAELDKMPDIDPILGHFAAMWAVHAFQRLSTSHTYAAALMCTDADRESLSTIQQQWSAFSVMVPNGMLCAESPNAEMSFEFTRILVALFEGRAEMNLIDFTGPGGALRMTIGSDAPTLPELLAPDRNVPPKFISADEWSAGLGTSAAEQIRRCLTMAKRLVAGLLLSMQNAEATKTRDVPRRAGRPGKRDEEEPAHRLVVVGQPIKIDCREAVETFIRTGRGSGGKRSGLPQVQWIVRGHWRQQAYGIGRLGRKTIWIKPHWAGKADAPILSRPKLVT